MTEVNTNECAVDTTSRDILLALALEEGLVSHVGFADGYADALRERKTPKWAKKQVLEQLVLSPRFLAVEHTGWGTLKAWNGPLIEEEVLVEAPPTGNTEVSHREVPFEAYLGILRARGDKRNARTIKHEFDQTIPMLDEYGDLLKRYPDLHQRAHDTKLQKRLQQEGMNIPVATAGMSAAASQLNDDELEAYQRLDSELSSRAASAPGRNDFMNGLAVAKEHKCLLRTMLRPSSFDVDQASPELPGKPGQDDVILLRIVAEGIGRTPARTTLKETLKLARSRPAASLREVLGNWTDAISNGDTSVLKKIPKEIELAQEGLRRAGYVGGVGTFVTWMSVPTAAAEIAIGSPGIVGAGLAVLGLASQEEKRRRERKHAWAMFGSL